MKKRNKKEKKSITPHLRYLFILGLLFVIFVMGSQQITEHIKRSRLFAIKTIIVEPPTDFPEIKEFAYLKGKNIFDIDPDLLQGRLQKQYPHIAYLKVVKRFPDTLVIIATRRNPFAQISIRHHLVIIDGSGVVLSEMATEDKNLPLIKGIKAEQKMKVGTPLTAKDLHVALTIIKIFRENPGLASYPISGIDVENLSKITMSIGNNLNIILDREQVKQKFKMLELMLSQSKIDLEKVKYIDFRFKEPIVGKKKEF